MRCCSRSRRRSPERSQSCRLLHQTPRSSTQVHTFTQLCLLHGWSALNTPQQQSSCYQMTESVSVFSVVRLAAPATARRIARPLAPINTFVIARVFC